MEVKDLDWKDCADEDKQTKMELELERELGESK